MNVKKAKALRKISSQIFLMQKASGKEEFQNIEAGQKIYLEQTNKRKFEKQPDYKMSTQFGADGKPVLNKDGTEKFIWTPKVDSNGKPVMRDVQLNIGPIMVHPASERGLYRRLKKNFKQDSKGFVNKLPKQAKVVSPPPIKDFGVKMIEGNIVAE